MPTVSVLEEHNGMVLAVENVRLSEVGGSITSHSHCMGLYVGNEAGKSSVQDG